MGELFLLQYPADAGFHARNSLKEFVRNLKKKVCLTRKGHYVFWRTSSHQGFLNPLDVSVLWLQIMSIDNCETCTGFGHRESNEARAECRALMLFSLCV